MQSRENVLARRPLLDRRLIGNLAMTMFSPDSVGSVNQTVPIGGDYRVLIYLRTRAWRHCRNVVLPTAFLACTFLRYRLL